MEGREPVRETQGFMAPEQLARLLPTAELKITGSRYEKLG